MPRTTEDRLRHCKQCGSEFEVMTSGRKSYCTKKCMAKFHWLKQGAKYRNSDKGKETAFAWRLKSTFGITVDEYNELLKQQNQSCAICYRTEPTGYGWHVDHCHTTGKVRGLLCSKCNQGLGLFDDNTNHLSNAINYLKKHESSSNLS